MKKYIGKTVRIIAINNKTNTNIIHYLHTTGIIVGYKIFNQQYLIPIIEFKDYTRIWMLTKEIKFINNTNI